MSVDGFWGHVLYGSDEGSDAFVKIVIHHEFRKAVICEFDVAFFGDKYVFRFELSVNNSIFVKILYANNDLCKHISDDYFWQDCTLPIRVEIEIAFG